ncbi:MAG: ATP-binding protein, partial [Lachnospiraceae bacterium]|nr:ATP-binding protein [Lachnospiraceae bacterium]
MPLKNYQYNSIIRQYDARRLESHRRLEERRKLLYEQLPELSEIDREISRGSVECAKRSLRGDAGALEGLRARNAELSDRKTAILQEHGYPADYLEPCYFCPDCQDTGFIGNEKCHCFRQAVVDILYAQSNVRRAVEEENFENFSYQYYSDSFVDETVNQTPLANIRRVVATAKEFVEHFDDAHENLLIYGNTGVGKTFLSNCIAKELLAAGHTVIYLTAFQLFDILEHYKFDRASAYDEHGYEEAANRFSYILDCDLLIIDDLGTELTNAFISSQLSLCVNERLLGQKSTVISTNLSFEQLK